MKTRKITVFAIASILGAIALTGCGSVVESSKNVGHAQPATQPATQAVTEAATEAAKSAEQNSNVVALSNTAQNNNVAQSVSYDASANTVSYTQAPVQTQAPAQQTVQTPVQNTTPAYQAATSTEQAAANNAIAYAGGNGYKIISSEAVQTNDGSAVYRFGIVPVDNAKAPAWYYYAGENFAMTEGEWISKKDTLSKNEWDTYQDSAEHRYAMASQQAGQNAIAASGISDAIITSCDFVNYDYDKLRYEFKVGVRSMNDTNAKIQYFMAGTDYAVKCEG
ncbi:MAG TPA: hypothetical protein PLH83_11880 [Ruminococcus sp.]|nr:hypothetical protein [Ruminococcus sp.]